VDNYKNRVQLPLCMDFDDLLKRNADEVNAELKRFLPRQATDRWIAEAVGTSLYGRETVDFFLSVPVWDFLDRGGKRWRPLLMFLACEAVGGDAKQIGAYSIIPELIHNGTLIVDDVEDGSPLRRGKPSLNISHGPDIAVNAGNLLYYLPLIVVQRSALPIETKLRIYELVNTEMLLLHFGQGSDIAWHKGMATVSEAQYMTMCASKTGTLARLAAKLGAILGRANEDLVGALGAFSESIGVAFQIQDDLLNLTGGLGKVSGEDITEGKMSLPVIKALSVGSAEENAQLLDILRKHSTDPEDIRAAIDIITRLGALKQSSEAAGELVAQSWAALEPELQASDAKEKLHQLAEFMIRRSH
jgi:geranylgeranyl diphosphate synthase, type I